MKFSRLYSQVSTAFDITLFPFFLESFCYNIIPTWHTQFCHECKATPCTFIWTSQELISMINSSCKWPYYLQVFQMMKLFWMMLNIILWSIFLSNYNLIFLHQHPISISVSYIYHILISICNNILKFSSKEIMRITNTICF